MSSLLETALEMPRMLVIQLLRPIRVAVRRPVPHPKTQRELADLVDNSLKHEIRAGFTHRFITILFVTVGERVFCRRYSYGEPSWHSFFQRHPAGQVRLDRTVVKIEARVPQDLDEIVRHVDQAYADSLKKLGASYMLAGATEPRARESTMEVSLADLV